MNEDKRGYWIYSIVAIIIGFFLFGFWGYLIYDLILKLSEKDFSNNTVIQALISLVVTVFLGGYFTKLLERKNAKKLEILKTQKDIAIRIIDLASAYYYDSENEKIKYLLFAEKSKIQLFFNNEVLSAMESYLNHGPTEEGYKQLVNAMQKAIK